ncbi:MAG: beta strand repeat-containing protein, partial [Roseimicrobium sp.]
ATTTDTPQSSAIAGVDYSNAPGEVKKKALAIGITIADLTYDSQAYFGKYAEVDAAKVISVYAKTSLPYDIKWADVGQSSEQGAGLIGPILGSIVSKVNPNGGIQNGFFTSWGQASANAQDMAVAGSLNIFDVTPSARAFIDEFVKVNQKTTLDGSTAVVRANQEVLVQATSELQTVNLAGNISYLGLPFIPGTAFYGIKSGNAIGAAILILNYTTTTIAEIRKGVTMNARTLYVSATTNSGAINFSQSGGSAAKYGAIGVSAVMTVNNRTIASIDDGVTITLLSGPTQLRNSDGSAIMDGSTPVTVADSLSVLASDDIHIVNIGGGFLRAQSVGVGISAPIAIVNRVTKAFIGNDPDDTTATDDTGSINTTGTIAVKAVNSGYIANVGIAGSYATSKPVDPSDPNAKFTGGAGEFGVGISGDFTMNDVSDRTLAFVRQATIASGTGLSIVATNSTELMALGGAVAISASDPLASSPSGLAGSVAYNKADNETKAFIDASSITLTGNLLVKAEIPKLYFGTGGTKANYIALSAGIGVVLANSISGTSFSVAGSVGYNEIENDTHAFVKGSDVSLNSGTATISAVNDAMVVGVGGTLEYGGRIGVGAAAAINEVSGSTEAYLENTDLTAASVSISANTGGQIIAVAAAFAYSGADPKPPGGFHIEIAITYNTITVATRAYIIGNKTTGGAVTASTGDVTIQVNDTSSIYTGAGAVGVVTGTSSAAGAAIAFNTVTNSSRSSITSAKVTSTAGKVSLTASSRPRIIGIALGVAVSTGQAKFTGAGSVASNTIATAVEASIKTSSTVTA